MKARASLLMLSFLTAAAVPAPTQAAPERVTSVEGITEYRLGNGLRVLLFPDPSKPTITVNMTILVGSRHENYGETGMAHLLEHLAFKGTPKHPNIPQELTAHGARPNGTTWWDRTNYFETFAASDTNLRWALELEADRLVNSFIAKKDLDSEMTVVRNEFEAGENNPLAVLEERTTSTAYLWHNYGKSTIGARSDLEQVPIDRLQAFYRTWYQPDNSVLLVAGNFDEKKTLALIDEIYSPIPRPARTLPTTYTVEPTQDGEREVTLRRVGDIQALCAVFHAPAGAHPDFAAIELINEILADTPSGRLHQALVVSGKASSVRGAAYQLRDPGMVVITAEVLKEKSIAEARAAMVEVLDGLASKPPTREEVERARAKLLKNIELRLNQPDRVGLELSEWLGMGDWRLFFLHRDRLRTATVEDVARVARTYFKPSNRTLGAFLPEEKPERAEIPPTPDVASLLKDYKGDAAVVAGEAFDASPANIDARTSRLKLSTGTAVALLPKQTRGSTVVAALSLRYGSEQSLKDRATLARITGDMLMRGSKKHSRQQIQDELDRLKARVQMMSFPGQLDVSIETLRANLPEVLALVTEILREPAFPASELEELRTERIAEAEQARSEPRAIAFNRLARHQSPYPPGDVRHVDTPDEEIAGLKTVKLTDLAPFHRDFFGAQSAQVAVVGDFDPAALKTQLETLLAGFKASVSYARVPRPFQEVAVARESIEAPDKANAVLAAGLPLKIRDDHADYPALVLGNYMLGGGFLNSRLATRIRQKEGLSYGVGSRFTAQPLDEAALFQGMAIYAPENVSRLLAAFHEEIVRATRDGFTAEEVNEARSGWLQSQQVGRAQDPQLVRTLASHLFLDRTLAWDQAVEDRIRTLTPEQIGAAMRKHISDDRISTFVSGDFARAKAAASGAVAQSDSKGDSKAEPKADAKPGATSKAALPGGEKSAPPDTVKTAAPAKSKPESGTAAAPRNN